MAYQPTDNPGPSFNVALNPQNKPTAQMDTVFPNLETGEQFQNICLMQPKVQYPKWPQAISSFTYGQLDKPPQEEVDPAFAAQFEKPFISSAPDPSIMFPPVLAAAAPFHDGSQTPLKDPATPVYAPRNDNKYLPFPAKPKPMAVAPALAKAPAPAPAPDDQACQFGSAGFSLQKIPSCMLTSGKTFLHYITHWKTLPGNTATSKLKHLLLDNSRLFYLLAWFVIVLFVVAGFRKLVSL